LATDDARTDAELVAAINRGNWAAFELLYFRHRDWVYRLAWRFCADETDAADVVQEVFIYLAGKFPGFELTAALTTFLYPAVKHTAVTLKKKRARMKGLAEEIKESLAAPVLGKETSESRRELAEILRSLSEEHREVLLMRFVDDMSLDEIAAALKVPTGTVKSRLHHAVRGVREDARIVRWLSD
jgi:RNA polymerase sigma-70 factor (ECF subfamily)